jgi:hypothetical protein
MAMSTDLPIIETAVQGWRDAASAREKMPTLFWIVIAILIGLGILHVLIGGWSYFSFIASVVFALAQALALTPFAIAIHRFVLLDEARDNYDFTPADPRFQKFFLFTIALGILGAIPQVIAFLFVVISPFLSSIILLILGIGTTIIAVRCAILFPSIAIDSTGADWQNAMEDTKGHSWRVFLVLLCTFLPTLVIEIVLIALFSWSWLLSAIVLGLILPVITVFTVAAVAASVSRLFAAYGNRLGRPANLYLRPAA